jgi:pimeloyl-ACP methyl ester carboxylesterase
MDIVLIAGLWMNGATAWDEVTSELVRLGHRPLPVALPGQGDGNRTATLADQLAAVLAAVDAATGPALVVGHSAASTLAWLAADARQDRVARVAFIGGWPAPDGQAYLDAFPVTDGVVPFPGWAEFEGPDSADLDAAAKQAIAAAAVPVPEGVTRGVVRYTDPRRHSVPAVLVCPEFSPAEARELIDQGKLPELAAIKDLAMADIDSGHWPMFSAPAELARIIDQAAQSA